MPPPPPLWRSPHSDISAYGFHNTKNVYRQNPGNFFHFNFGYEEIYENIVLEIKKSGAELILYPYLLTFRETIRAMSDGHPDDGRPGLEFSPGSRPLLKGAVAPAPVPRYQGAW